MFVAPLLSRWLGRLWLLLWLAVVATAISEAQRPSLPDCADRPRHSQELYADRIRWCVERIVQSEEVEPLSFTALATAPDGTLFATRPLSGEVMIIRDSDGDTLPDAMETFADGLSLPNGLAYFESQLYVAGGASIYRISLDGEVTTLVDDLPVGAGFATGGIAIGADQRLYVAMGAPCSLCEFDEAERGAILSLDLDGGDRRLVASGFRNPADLAFYRDELWTLDSAPRQYRGLALDELNRVINDGWYGFPYCLGGDTVGIASRERGCDDSVAPAMRFGTGANPSSLAAYPHDLLPGTEDTLIVVLRGDPSQVDIVGYKVIMITFDEADQPLGATILVPFRFQTGVQAYSPYRDEGLFWSETIYLSEQGYGIYPQHPLAVAVSPQGWIYISITGGRIVALRPKYEEYSYDHLYPRWTPMHPEFDPAAPP